MDETRQEELWMCREVKSLELPCFGFSFSHSLSIHPSFKVQVT